MINLMIKNIFENTKRIDSVAKCVNKINKRNCFGMLMVAVTVYTITKTVEKHEQEIEDLKKEIKEMKSKGE